MKTKALPKHLRELNKEQLDEIEGSRGHNKHQAERTWSELCQRWFASKAEATRGEELRMLEMADVIRELEYQPKFVLCEKPRITITLDFAYYPCYDWTFPTQEAFNRGLVYEDVKGVLTRDFRTKLAWLKEKYGIDVELVRR